MGMRFPLADMLQVYEYDTAETGFPVTEAEMSMLRRNMSFDLPRNRQVAHPESLANTKEVYPKH